MFQTHLSKTLQWSPTHLPIKKKVEKKKSQLKPKPKWTIYTKCPDQANLQRQKVRECLQWTRSGCEGWEWKGRVGDLVGTQEVTPDRYEVDLRSDENVLNLR